MLGVLKIIIKNKNFVENINFRYRNNKILLHDLL